MKFLGLAFVTSRCLPTKFRSSSRQALVDGAGFMEVINEVHGHATLPPNEPPVWKDQHLEKDYAFFKRELDPLTLPSSIINGGPSGTIDSSRVQALDVLSMTILPTSTPVVISPKASGVLPPLVIVFIVIGSLMAVALFIFGVSFLMRRRKRLGRRRRISLFPDTEEASSHMKSFQWDRKAELFPVSIQFTSVMPSLPSYLSNDSYPSGAVPNQAWHNHPSIPTMPPVALISSHSSASGVHRFVVANPSPPQSPDGRTA